MRREAAEDAGVTLVEMAVSMAVTLIVAAGLLALVTRFERPPPRRPRPAICNSVCGPRCT